MNIPIVYAYPCRWDETPARQHYLMEAMSAHVPVVFLNSPQLTGRIFEAKRPRLERLNTGLTIIHDAFGFRYARSGRRFRRIAASIDSVWLHGLLREQGIHNYIYWLSSPSPEMLWGMQTERLIYDCIDPCFQSENQITHDQQEIQIARNAKIVFCTADALLEKMRKINPASYLLPNACSKQHFNGISLSPPKALESCPTPVIGYMGTFDSRVDVETLYQVALRLPQYTFALIGRINPDQEEPTRALRNLPNVIMPGSVSVEEGRAYTAAFDVGLIPFRPSIINDAINPVKMYMYLAAGKPIVTTYLRESLQYREFIQVTKNVSEFTAAVVSAVSKNSPSKIAARTEFARQNTWQVRAQTAAKYLHQHGLFDESGLHTNKEWAMSGEVL